MTLGLWLNCHHSNHGLHYVSPFRKILGCYRSRTRSGHVVNVAHLATILATHHWCKVPIPSVYKRMSLFRPGGISTNYPISLYDGWIGALVADGPVPAGASEDPQNGIYLAKPTWSVRQISAHQHNAKCEPGGLRRIALRQVTHQPLQTQFAMLRGGTQNLIR
jgi:hypothetical protein